MKQSNPVLALALELVSIAFITFIIYTMFKESARKDGESKAL